MPDDILPQYRLRIKNWDDLYENNRTRSLININWVPIPNRMDGDSYCELVDHGDAAAHYGAWIAMLAIASRQTPRGTLPREGAGIAQALARISRLPAGLFESLIPRVVEMGWVECFQGVMSNPAGGCGNPAPSCVNLATEGKERKKELTAPQPRQKPGAEIETWLSADFWPNWVKAGNDSRGGALKAAKAKAKTPEIRTAIMAVVMSAKFASARREQEPQFRKHAATWLNQCGWEDQLDNFPLFQTGPPPLAEYHDPFKGMK